jgi:hypothetical protein
LVPERKEEKRRAVPSVVPEVLMPAVTKVREAVLSAVLIVLLMVERERRRRKREDKVLSVLSAVLIVLMAKRIRRKRDEKVERVRSERRNAEKDRKRWGERVAKEAKVVKKSPKCQRFREMSPTRDKQFIQLLSF